MVSRRNRRWQEELNTGRVQPHCLARLAEKTENASCVSLIRKDHAVVEAPFQGRLLDVPSCVCRLLHYTVARDRPKSIAAHCGGDAILPLTHLRGRALGESCGHNQSG